MASAGPYSTVHQGPSTLSVGTYSSSFSSLIPSTPEYHFELERLRLSYKKAQEDLRAERDHAEAQRRLFDLERTELEARHQEELNELRRQLSSSSMKGKGKERS
jgi:ABC-type phosphonate transport system ATPase subunit